MATKKWEFAPGGTRFRDNPNLEAVWIGGPLMIRTLCLMLASGAIAVGVSAPSVSADYIADCPSGESGVATNDPSCEFAENVQWAWYRQPASTVRAFSPVAGRYITMQCAITRTDRWPEAKRCVGVNAYGAGLIIFFD